MVKAKIVQFRRGLKRIHERHYILDVGCKSIEEAEKFVGKEVVWTSPAGKDIKGKISAAHGNKGMVRSIFEKGLPGQARNSEVEVK
jgi:ribosomal protein L35AE/L33A